MSVISLLSQSKFLETCQSGRTSKPGKFVYAQVYRGFESLSLRIKAQNKVPKRHLYYFRRTNKRSLLSCYEGNNKKASVRRLVFIFNMGGNRIMQ